MSVDDGGNSLPAKMHGTLLGAIPACGDDEANAPEKEPDARGKDAQEKAVGWEQRTEGNAGEAGDGYED